ncbi:winged helix-turn-helix domain-containing protein [Streptomyces sp. Qhu-G9]|nr:winged helix-turn-helix domain-containing protein [Streptomyces aurantiacus]WAU84921.1 winged helix-turn-helix domain-containing protein [Streptomyces aurantiacus]
MRRRFEVDYTLAGLDLLLHRIGWSVQVPARRATVARRGEDRRLEGRAVARHKERAADLGARLCFEDEADQGLRPPKGRTWGSTGYTPVAKVTAAGTQRVSMAALICTRSGHQPRLIYRIHLDRGPAKGRRKGFTEADHARLSSLSEHKALLRRGKRDARPPVFWLRLGGRLPAARPSAAAARPSLGRCPTVRPEPGRVGRMRWWRGSHGRCVAPWAPRRAFMIRRVQNLPCAMIALCVSYVLLGTGRSSQEAAWVSRSARQEPYSWSVGWW